MVTKTKAPARKRVTAPTQAKPAKALAKAAAPAAEMPNLLRAGLQALDKARLDVAQRQSRVFEAILGFEPTQTTATKVAAEALGLRKFEAVFDQRVAHALERMGIPSAETLRALQDELASLQSEVAALKREARALKATRSR